MDYCSTKDNMNKAEMLSDDVTKNIRSIMLRLPNVLNKHNIYMFVMACEKIEKICSDAFNDAERLGIRDFFSCWRKLLIPFWKFGGVWENAYSQGFTWNSFLETILEEDVKEVRLGNNVKHPELIFVKDNIPEFTLTIVDED